jgi:hypothetical protein
MMSTTFVLVTDREYFVKATVTIKDLRSMGKWNGDIVLITLDDLVLQDDYKSEYTVQEVKFPSIDKTQLLQQIGPSGFANSDKRELYKLNQWEKLHVFDEYFTKWERVVFLDAGLRVLDSVHDSILCLNCQGKLLAPVDGTQMYDRPHDIFRHQLDHANEEIIQLIQKDFGEKIFESKHMLNCMWMYDTSLIHACNKHRLIDAMNRYPVCRTNEMGIMNLVFHFEMGVWERLPARAANGKYLFEWCELNNFYPTTWRDYCFLKYPISISIL